MANIVGLGSTQDAIGPGQKRLRDSATLLDGTVVKPVSLRPVASPVETYARPAQAPIDNNLQSLAEGLSSLAPGLARFAAASKKEDKEVDKDKVAMAINGKSPEEIGSMLASGNHPVFSKAVNAQYGGELAAQRQADADSQFLTNHYNTAFDKQNGDWNKEVSEFVAKRAQAYGNNPGFADKYLGQMAGYSRSSMGVFLKEKSEQATFQQTQQTQDGVASIIRNGVNTDAPQARLTEDLSVFMRNNKDVARQQYGDQAKMFVDGLRPILNDMDSRPQDRDKFYNALNTVLTAPRKGEDGVERRLIDAPGGVGEAYKGFLAEAAKKRDDLNNRYLTGEKMKFDVNAEHDPSSFTEKDVDDWNAANNFTLNPGQVQSIKTKRAQSLIKLADKRADDVAAEQARGARTTVTQQDLQSFETWDYRGGDTETPDKAFYKDGDTNAVKKFSGDERTEAVIKAYGQRLDAQENVLVNSGKMTAEQAKQWRNTKELETFSQNRMVPQAWKDEMNASINSLTTANSRNSNEMPADAMQGFERYKLLKAQAPNLIEKVADERTRKVFDAALASGATSPVDQLRGAVQYYANRDDKREEITKKQVAAAVTDITGKDSWGSTFKSWFGADVPENSGALLSQVNDRAAYMVQAYRMEPKKAVELAAKSLKGSFQTVNGHIINTNDKNLPANSGELATTYLRDLVSQYGAARFGARSSDDLTLVDQPDGSFQVINKHQGYMAEGAAPIVWKDGTTRDARFITSDMMQDLAKEQRQKAELRAVRGNEKAQAAQATRLEPLWTIPGVGVGIPKPSAGILNREESMTVQANARKNEAARRAAVDEQSAKDTQEEAARAADEQAKAEAKAAAKAAAPLTVGRGIRIR